MRVRISGYKQGVKVFDERHEWAEPSEEIAALGERHTRLLADAPHMIEVEFLDELDPNQRFFRFGTDPSGMVKPQAFDIADFTKKMRPS